MPDRDLGVDGIERGRFLDRLAKKAEVTHAHEAFGDNVEQEAADKFVGIEGHGLFSILIFSITVTKGDGSVMG